jgi:hypothetical protein
MTMQWAVRPVPVDSRASADQGSGFLPSNLPGLMFWVDSALGITLNGSNVSAWADQSGNGNSLQQPTAANQPAYTASDAAYNGQPSLTFLSTNPNWMDQANAFPVTVQPLSIYCVAHVTSTAGTSDLFDKVSGGASRILLQTSPGTATLVINASSVVGPTVATISTPSCIASVFNGASSAIYVNASGSPTTGNAGTSGQNKIEMGAFSGGTAAQMNGKFASLLVYSAAHTAAQVQQVFAYLGARFGISVS